MVYAERFGAMWPLEATQPINYDVYSDTLDDLPDGPRYRASKPSHSTWNEEQRLLKAFWMVYFARSFFKKLNQGGLDWPADKVAKASSLKAIDLFQFSRHFVCHTLFRKEDFASVQDHRLMMRASIIETESDYRYAEDTDEPWSP